MTVTTDYQSTIPFTIFQASPTLAALHAARYRLSHASDTTPLQPTHCSKCGSFLLSGQGEVRVRRVKKARVLQRTCQTCGGHDNLPLERGNAVMYPRRRRVAPKPAEPSPVNITIPPSTSITPAQPKARPKKRSGLQDMLLRNRKKQEDEKREKQSSSGGLAAYLAGL